MSQKITISGCFSIQHRLKLARYSRFESFSSFHRFSTAEFYTRCIGQWVSPMVMTVGFSPGLIKMCSMHTVHLGVCQWVNGSAIPDLVDMGFFGSGTLTEQLDVVTHTFNRWCRLVSIE